MATRGRKPHAPLHRATGRGITGEGLDLLRCLLNAAVALCKGLV